MALNNECGEEPANALLGLPVELRECIYEYYLTTLQPASFNIIKEPSREQWTLITRINRRTPSLLLVCHTISAEFTKLISVKISSGPIDGIPISRGPTIRIGPRWSSPSYSTTDKWEDRLEQENVCEVLLPILSKAACSMCLQLVMPQSPEDEKLFTCMLRFIAAVCNARETPLKYVRAVRDPLTGPGWYADINAIADEVSRIRCDRLEWENWYRPWYGVNSHTQSDPSGHIQEQISVDRARQEVLESCQEHSAWYDSNRRTSHCDELT